MKESPKKDTLQPGLEEALHPEIGNEAVWTNDVHAFSLSTVDPLKSLDQKILDPGSTGEILSGWKAEINGRSISEEPRTKETEDAKTSSRAKQPAQVTQDPLQTGPEITPMAPQENENTRDTTEAVSTSKKEKKKKDKVTVQASKRIRKLAEKMGTQEEQPPVEKFKITPPAPETSLSPFTHWLKGLTGSEYVHPYDDDFAFNRGSSHAGEGISETFADLLAAQGYKDQAIAMYTRLMEKFPEKSRFFAAKIEALQ